MGDGVQYDDCDSRDVPENVPEGVSSFDAPHHASLLSLVLLKQY